MDEELSRKLASARRILSDLRWLLLVAPVVGGLVGYAISKVVTPRYVSEITVSLKDQEVFNNLLKDLVAPENTKTSTASAKALLETAPVLDRVAIHAKLVDSSTHPNTKYQVRKRILSSFKIRQSGSETGLFTITSTYSDASAAQAISNALAKEFLRETASLRTRTAKLALGFLKEQMDKTWTQLEAKRSEMSEYRAKNLYSLPEFALDGTINLLQIRKDQIESTSKLAETRKRIQLIREYYAKSDPRLASLKAELSEIEARRERLKGDYTEMHPVMKELSFQVRQLKHLIAEHRPDTTTTMPRDRITVQLGGDGKPSYSASPGDAFLLGRQFQEQDLLLQEEMLQVKLAQYDSLLAGLKGGLEQIPDLQRKLAEQQAEIDRLKRSYDEIRTKWSDAEHSIEIGTLDINSEFSVVSPASLPEHPEYPVPFAFAIAGIFLSVLLVVGSGVGLTWWRGRVRDATDLQEVLGMQYLGTIPDLSGTKRARP
ncbi:MAG: hypothetical protein RL173_596 [Fibrobacterota bacterium]|jgi:uncharacterized protein involved in exopolysaccharide biosynthesis